MSTIDLTAIVALVARQDRCVEVVSPPYDAFDSGGRHAYARQHPDSFLNVILSANDYPRGAPRDLATRARETFDAMVERDLYERMAVPGYYLYELDTGDHRQLGVIAGIDNSHIAEGRVMGHEATLASRTDELASFYCATRLASSAVSLTYEDDGALKHAIQTVAQTRDPIREFVSADGVAQRLWHVADPSGMQAIDAAAARVARLYITDGHHRVEAAGVDGATPGSILGVIFPPDELQVHEYNRCVELDAAIDPGGLLEALAGEWEIRELGRAGTVDPRPGVVGELAMLVGGRWYRLTAIDVPPDPLAGLDVVLLHSRVIGPLLGVTDDSDRRLSFVVGNGAAVRLESMCTTDRHVGFALHPTELDQLMRIADAGETMPPKSTYFLPKARSGLLVVEW